MIKLYWIYRRAKRIKKIRQHRLMLIASQRRREFTARLIKAYEAIPKPASFIGQFFEQDKTNV